MPTPPRILVADDHPVTVRGIRDTLLCLGAEVEVTFQPRGVMVWLSQRTFDMLVLDISFRDFKVTGFDVLRALRESHPELPVLMVSVYDDAALQDAARCEGARGFLSKVEPSSVWGLAVKEILAGGTFFRVPEDQPRDASTLSTRQWEVTHLLSSGLSEEDCARELGISRSMVEKHGHEAKRRVGARSLGQLIREFVARGFHLLPSKRSVRGRSGGGAEKPGSKGPA